MKRALALALIVLLSTPTLQAAPLAVFSGSVTSLAGKPLPGTGLELVNVDTGRTASVVADAAGRFRLSLDAGLYSVATRTAQPIVRGPRVVRLVAGGEVATEVALSVQEPTPAEQTPKKDDDDDDGAVVLTPSARRLSGGDIAAISLFAAGLAAVWIRAATHKDDSNAPSPVSPSR